MSRWQDQPRDAHERITIRKVWLTLALSLLIHIRRVAGADSSPGDTGSGPEEPSISAPVQVQLVPQGSPTPPATAAAPPEPTAREAQAAITPPVRPPPRSCSARRRARPWSCRADARAGDRRAPPAPIAPPPRLHLRSPPRRRRCPPRVTWRRSSSRADARAARRRSEDTSDDYKRNLAANLPAAPPGPRAAT